MIKFILTVVFFYYLFRLIGRVILPLFMANRIKKMQRQHQAYTRGFSSHSTSEGRVTVETPKQKKQKLYDIDKDEAEYVDYEEIKD